MNAQEIYTTARAAGLAAAQAAQVTPMIVSAHANPLGARTVTNGQQNNERRQHTCTPSMGTRYAAYIRTDRTRPCVALLLASCFLFSLFL